MNKCDACGKFKKWDDLYWKVSFDYHSGNEHEWRECYECAGIPLIDHQRILQEYKNAPV